MLEDRSETHEPDARARQAVVDRVVLRRPRRAEGRERPVGLGDLEAGSRFFETARRRMRRRLRARGRPAHLERPELALRIPEDVLDR